VVAALFAFIVDLAWGLATFFVVPVLALERVGPITAVRRSATVFRRQWGEQVTGDIAIGIIFTFAMVPGLIAGYVAWSDFHSGSASGAAGALAVALALLAPPVVLSSALTELFTLVLYRDATGRGLVEPFSVYDLETAFRPRRVNGAAQWIRRRFR